VPIFFHTESVQFSFNKRNLFKKWISLIVERHKKTTGSINIIFTSNDYLRSVNQEYLYHDYNTDVITFEYNEEKLISGDIFVSVEQVKINAESFDNSFVEELNRVVIHGVLHLLGFKDATVDEKKEIRGEEDKALALLNTAE
jgi:probable rRNA maturation factor